MHFAALVSLVTSTHLPKPPLVLQVGFPESGNSSQSFIFYAVCLRLFIHVYTYLINLKVRVRTDPPRAWARLDHVLGARRCAWADGDAGYLHQWP